MPNRMYADLYVSLTTQKMMIQHADFGFSQNKLWIEQTYLSHHVGVNKDVTTLLHAERRRDCAYPAGFGTTIKLTLAELVLWYKVPQKEG